jgi:hypothetical protein
MAATIAHYPRTALAATSKSPSPTNGNLSIYCKHHHPKKLRTKISLRLFSLVSFFARRDWISPYNLRECKARETLIHDED